MLRILFACVVVASVSFGASAQTTRPTQAVDKEAAVTAVADQAWPAAVEAFAKMLVRGNLPAAEAMLSARATVRRFDVTHDGELSRMVGRVARSTIVGQHAYLHPPLVMAADIAADFKNAAAIPDKNKVRFVIDDESEMKRANATAVQWVAEQLDAHGGVPVGVIILWTPRPAAPGVAMSDSVNYDAVFVLCRGEEVAPREFKITAVVYGNPIPEVNQ